MFKQIFARCQGLLPQHLLSVLMGQLSNTKTPWFKNAFIDWFVRTYHVNMRLALEENPHAYPTFNDFFIRRLKPALRPIDQNENSIVSPVDGTIAQIGSIKQNQLLQAKNFYFTLDTLFANYKEFATPFYDGLFATLYLAPYDYHRVHMPWTGELVQNLYVPGRLFSVNKMTSDIIPQLYSRNERFISIFNTSIGSMAVILVGAILVGSIQMSWMDKPVRSNQPYKDLFSPHLVINKGDELGNFHMGSTVIILFEKNTIEWLSPLHPQSNLQYGERIGMVA